MAGTERITERKVRKAIIGSYGQINKVAQRAGCNVRTIERKLKQYPELQELLEEEKNVLVELLDELSDNAIYDTLTRKKVSEESGWTRQDEDRRVKVAMWLKDRNKEKNGGGTGDVGITLNFIDKEGDKFEKKTE
jgi:hypothetical protein